MAPLDERAHVVERREQVAVAEGPVLAAAQSRAGDADDGAEDDEEICAERGEPGEPRERTSHGGEI